MHQVPPLTHSTWSPVSTVVPRPVDQPRFPKLDRICDWLNDTVEWPNQAGISFVGVNRLWVGKHARLTVEFGIELTEGDSFRVYRLQGKTGPVRRARSSRTKARFARHGLAGLGLYNADLGLVCTTPDRDRDLPAVRDLLDPQRSTAALVDTPAAQELALSPSDDVHCRLITYRISKRCSMHVSRITDRSTGGVFLKVFKRPPSLAVVEALRRLDTQIATRSQGRLRVPPILGFLPERNLLITRGISGSLANLGTSHDDLKHASSVLASLHETEVPGLRMHTAIDEFQTACRWVRALHTLGYRQHHSLRELVKALAPDVDTIDSEGAVVIHRDFYTGQLLRSDETLWLTDFDTLTRGHPEVDLSTFAAHTILDSLMAEQSRQDVLSSVYTLLSGYQRAGRRISSERMTFYLPCALARLGGIALTRGVPESIVQTMWDLATDCQRGCISLI